MCQCLLACETVKSKAQISTTEINQICDRARDPDDIELKANAVMTQV